MFGWHITGTWKAGGKSRQESFLQITRTQEREEAIGLALAHLVDQAVQQLGPAAAGGVAVELTEAPELVEDPIVGTVERALAS